MEKGKKYDLENARLIGWTPGDGSGAVGYYMHDYFEPDGTYAGPDMHGIEPIIEDISPLSADGE